MNTAELPDTHGKPRVFGFVGTLIGLLALITVTAHFFMGPIAQPEPVESFVAEKTVSIKNAIVAKMKGEEYTPPAPVDTFDPDALLTQIAVGAGMLALSLGVFGFLRREERMPCGLALFLGSATIAFSFSVMVVGLLVGAIIIGAIIVTAGGMLGLG